MKIATWVAAAFLIMTATAEDLSRALLDSATAGDAVKVQSLLRQGAGIESKDKDGRTPLMLAAQHGRTATVTALLAAGANAEARDRSGFTAYGLTYFSPAGHGSHEAALRALPQPPRLRLSVIAGWTTQQLVSSCFQHREQIVQQIGLMKPDELLLRELQAFAVSSGKGMAQLVAVDAKGVEPLRAEANANADGVVNLEIEPGSACAGGSSDKLTFSITIRVLRGRDAKQVFEKRIGGGFKGLREQFVENAAQYRPVFENWMKQQPQIIYWDAVEALMKSLL